MCALHEDRYTLLISRTNLLKMRNISENVAHKIETNFIFSNFFYKNYAVSEIMWKNMVQPERQQI